MSAMPPSAEEEERLKKARRAEKIREARHFTGEVCIVMGKTCVVIAGVVGAACGAALTIASCVMSCLPSDQIY
jgi:hypothetical protein